MQTFQTFTLLYLTRLVYLRLWFWSRLPKLRKEKVGSLLKSEREKLQKLYTRVGAPYESVHNLVKTSNLSVSKVRQFLLSKPSYTKYTPATGTFKQMKAFASFKNELWCMNLARFDKLAKHDNGVKYLLLRQDLFDRNLDAKGMETKHSKETVRAILTIITENTSWKILGWQGNRICWRVQKTMQSWRNTNLLYSDWDQGCNCWTYNTIPGKCSLQLLGRLWIQVHSQFDSIPNNTKF